MSFSVDKARGCLIAGAAGDALGYAVEFLKEDVIFARYGQNGITSYELGSGNRAVISDDTQMTVFTAYGLLAWSEDKSGEPYMKVERAYRDWYATQRGGVNPDSASFLMRDERLFHRRAPGNTCLSGCAKNINEGLRPDYFEQPINDSKGCGGIMRVAPAAFLQDADVYTQAALCAALTHGHKLGYLPAAVQAGIIRNILDGCEDVCEAASEAAARVKESFPGPFADVASVFAENALNLSRNAKKDIDNIHSLGEGWTGEDAMAIGIYCAARYGKDVSSALIAAVNHSGDSDSTGAVTGNIVGTLAGYEAMEDKWKQNLELSDTLIVLADDLAGGQNLAKYRFD